MGYRPTASLAPTLTWLDSLLFLALMSGPPKFRYRDSTASLAGTIDLAALIQIGVWACGGLWVIMSLYPWLRRGLLPAVNPVQVAGALFIVSLSLSIRESPGVLLTAFTLGQLAVMLSFAWVFTHRFGTSAYLRHLFFGVSVLALGIAAAALAAPDLVITDQRRLIGERIAPTGAVAVIGFVFCLSNIPALKFHIFWGMVLLLGVLLAASQTRAAYVALVMYLAIGCIYGKGLPVRKFVPLLVAFSLSLFLLDALSSTTDYIVRDPQTLETMSDRIPLWGHLISAVMREAPLTGLGYYAASRILAAEYNPNLGHAHSVFVEVLVGGGLVGAALYVVLCASLLWYAGRLLRTRRGQPETIAAVGLLAVTVVMGITSPAGLNAGPVGFSFWSLTALLPSLWRRSAHVTVFGEQRLPVRKFGLAGRAAGGWGARPSRSVGRRASILRTAPSGAAQSTRRTSFRVP
jgi:O-antigen ligase